MRLSDAIALGRMLVVPTPNGGPNPNENSGQGCALQIAFAAIGDMHSAYYLHGPDICKAIEIWGYTADQCWKQFDKQAYRPDFSLDAFIDWVRSIEPPEETEHSTEVEEFWSDARVTVYDSLTAKQAESK